MGLWVMVTGATGGIGTALVRRCLGEENITGVAGVYRSRSKWDAVFGQEQKQYAEKLRAAETRPEACREVLRQCLRQDSGAELIYIMAAYTIEPLEAVVQIPHGALAENLHANLELPVLQLQEAVKLCREYAVPMRIVYLNSGASKRPIKGWGLYGAGKSYMNLLLKTVALEEGIPAVSIDPGVVDTAMQEQIRRTPEEIFDQVQLFRDYQRLGRLRSPEEVADYLVERYVLSWKAEEFEELLR